MRATLGASALGIVGGGYALHEYVPDPHLKWHASEQEHINPSNDREERRAISPEMGRRLHEMSRLFVEAHLRTYVKRIKRARSDGGVSLQQAFDMTLPSVESLHSPALFHELGMSYSTITAEIDRHAVREGWRTDADDPSDLRRWLRERDVQDYLQSFVLLEANTQLARYDQGNSPGDRILAAILQRMVRQPNRNDQTAIHSDPVR